MASSNIVHIFHRRASTVISDQTLHTALSHFGDIIGIYRSEKTQRFRVRHVFVEFAIPVPAATASQFAHNDWTLGILESSMYSTYMEAKATKVEQGRASPGRSGRLIARQPKAQPGTLGDTRVPGTPTGIASGQHTVPGERIICRGCDKLLRVSAHQSPSKSTPSQPAFLSSVPAPRARAPRVVFPIPIFTKARKPLHVVPSPLAPRPPPEERAVRRPPILASKENSFLDLEVPHREKRRRVRSADSTFDTTGRSLHLAFEAHAQTAEETAAKLVQEVRELKGWLAAEKLVAGQASQNGLEAQVVQAEAGDLETHAEPVGQQAAQEGVKRIVDGTTLVLRQALTQIGEVGEAVG